MRNIKLVRFDYHRIGRVRTLNTVRMDGHRLVRRAFVGLNPRTLGDPTIISLGAENPEAWIQSGLQIPRSSNYYYKLK